MIPKGKLTRIVLLSRHRMKTVPNDSIYTYRPVHVSIHSVKKLLAVVHNSHKDPQFTNPQIGNCKVFNSQWDIHCTPLSQSLRDLDGGSRGGGKLQGNDFPDTTGQLLV